MEGEKKIKPLLMNVLVVLVGLVLLAVAFRGFVMVRSGQSEKGVMNKTIFPSQESSLPVAMDKTVSPKVFDSSGGGTKSGNNGPLSVIPPPADVVTSPAKGEINLYLEENWSQAPIPRIPGTSRELATPPNYNPQLQIYF